jgi:hypothetical protein
VYSVLSHLLVAGTAHPKQAAVKMAVLEGLVVPLIEELLGQGILLQLRQAKAITAVIH